MITKLFRQIWNERRQNVWLFIEIFVVSLTVWLAIDPLTELVSRSTINPNYNEQNVYTLVMNRHRPGKLKYRAEFDNDSLTIEQFLQIINIIETCPEIESYSLTNRRPGENLYGDNFTIDSTQNVENKTVTKRIHYLYNYSNGRNDIFGTFGVKAPAGYDPQKQSIKGVYISRSLMKELYGTEEITGKSITHKHNGNYPILGTIDDIQHNSYFEPIPTIFFSEPVTLKGSSLGFLGHMDINIRVKKSVDNKLFEEKFRTEIMPKLTAGNIYCRKLSSVAQQNKDSTKYIGISSQYKQNIILSIFALLCGFLGIAATFWVRAVERRHTIGIMQSVGATRSNIIGQFATEAATLSSIAFALALVIVLHKVLIDGFAQPLGDYINIDEIPKSDYLHHLHVPRFLTVTAISYAFITIISIVGAIIPICATMQKRPADAMREE